MKTILLVLAAVLPLGAQVVSPTTGKKFETRTINGSGGNNGVSINGSTTPAPPPKAKLVSYFSLSESRQWKSNDGRSLLGSIIAFEESVIEIDAANPAAAREAAQKAPPAKLPEKPTLIRDGKVRLLVNNKPYEVALELLSTEDRKFVEDLNAKLPK
jgi:aspartate 1-decarboxylase